MDNALKFIILGYLAMFSLAGVGIGAFIVWILMR